MIRHLNKVGRNAGSRTNTQTGRILRFVDTQIVLKPSQPRCSNVVPIQIIHDIDQHKQRASRIQLPLQTFLDFGAALRAHSCRLTIFLDHLGLARVVVDGHVGFIVWGCHFGLISKFRVAKLGKGERARCWAARNPSYITSHHDSVVGLACIGD